MKQLLTFPVIITIGFLALTWSSCSPSKGGNPGHEFMPDMFHSIAYEANVYDYYFYNTWGSENDYRTYADPRRPVKGTIPRGYAGMENAMDMKAEMEHFQAIAVNGHVPYYYTDTEDERTRATNEILANPFAISDPGLAKGKELYDIFCGICHGDTGDGGGYLVRDDGGVYPAQPANFLLPEFVDASEGRYYHSIIYGKNMMGPYADKLSFEERWQVIHYIRLLQANELGEEYSSEVNTLNAVGIPQVTLVDLDLLDEEDEHSTEEQSTEIHDLDHH